MHIAYLIPTYPMPSQTFIRCEIAALEAQGFKIERFSLRRFADELADEADRIEQQKTCSILSVGAAEDFAGVLLLELVTQPRRWFKAAATRCQGRSAFRTRIAAAPGVSRRSLRIASTAGAIWRFASSCSLRHQRVRRRTALSHPGRSFLQHHDSRS